MFFLGLITQNWSGTVIEYQKLLSVVNWDDYIASGNDAEKLQHQKDKLGRVVEETVVGNVALGLTVASLLAVAVGVLLKGSRLLRAK